MQDNQFGAFASMVNREDWLEDSRFATPTARRETFGAVYAELSVTFASRDAAEWEADLSTSGLPCAMIRTVNEAVDLASEAGLLHVTFPTRASKWNPDRPALPNRRRGSMSTGTKYSRGSPRKATRTLNPIKAGELNDQFRSLSLWSGKSWPSIWDGGLDVSGGLEPHIARANE